MDRRAFLAGTGAALLAAPLANEVQRAGRIPFVRPMKDTRARSHREVLP